TFSSADSRSCATAGSAPSLIVTPAVVCGTYTSAAAAPFVVASASCTSLVMSTSWVRRSVLRRISCTARRILRNDASSPAFRPRQAARAGRTRQRHPRRAHEPAAPRRRARGATRRARPRLRELSRALPQGAPGVGAGRAGRAVPALPRLDAGPLRGRRRQAVPRARRRAALRGATLGRPAPLPRPRVGSDVPRRPDGAGAREHAGRPRHRPEVTGERHARPRRAPEQKPTRVLRADRGAGPGRARDPAHRRAGRLAGALPRGRPYGALRPHVP